jgi:probable phosphoglycerate mutase
MTLRTGIHRAAGRKPVTIYFLRHAHSQANNQGILAGRTKGIKLSTRGKKEAEGLVQTLGTLDFTEIYSSPLERCRETINPFCQSHPGIPIHLDEAFIEMNYGEWSGLKLAHLARKKMWATIQSNPSSIRFPVGESFLEMSTRAIEGIEKIRTNGKNALVVSHGDVIRVILNHYLGAHLDNFQRLSIDPASISRITFHGEKVNINTINMVPNISGTKDSTLGGGSGKK